MGVELPFLPFASEEENIQFVSCISDDNFPSDEGLAAIAWCKYVDGVKIFPKLPVHIRTHRETFERNQRVEELTRRAASGLAKLEELNKVTTPSVTEEQTQIRNPAPLPTVQPEIMHNDQNIVTAGMCVGLIPESEPIQSKNTRGGDKKNVHHAHV